MKKLLLATGILALSAVAFGAPTAQTSTNPYASDEVLVKAKVIAPLEVVKTKDLDFGTVLVGDTNAVPVQKGMVEVKGDQNANVKVEISGTGDYSEKILKNVPVTLKNKGTGEMIVAVDLETAPTTGPDVFNLGTAVQGKAVLPLTFNAKITQAASEAGIYEGVLHVRAKYNDYNLK